MKQRLQKILKDLPVKRKLMLVVLATCGTILMLACAGIFLFQIYLFKQTFTRDLRALAAVVAANSAGPVSFGDQQAAQEVLGALKSRPQVVAVSIRLPDGSDWVHWGSELANWEGRVRARGLQEARSEGIKGGDYHVEQPIQNKTEMLGTLHLWANFNNTYRDLVYFYALALALVLLGSFLVAILMSARLQGFISEPILELAAVAREIAEEKNYAVRAEPQGQDEVGELTRAFNEMLGQIQERAHEVDKLHKELLDASRQAGMAEVASGVLHNVGNVLNSVNVSSAVVSERVTKIDVVSLRDACALFKEHIAELPTYLTTDPQGRQLPEFLGLLAEEMASEQNIVLKELESLRKNIDHIKEIVAMQQDYAKVSGFIEILPVAPLVEDALRLNAGALTRHKIEVVREYDEVPPLSVDKHRVLQILVNLIRNAKYALDERGHSDKRLTIRIGRNERNCIKIDVSDNGIGIPAENLPLIFRHGFTTRRDGHGFGLHSGALAAQEMGGSLRVYSEGPGHGATFTLELPSKPKNDNK
jgi:signal transduction histidine kinase